MLRSPKSVAIALLGSILILSGCQTMAEPSGFLTSYKEFRPGPEGGADLIWVTSEIKTDTDWNNLLKDYNKILIDPIWVSMSSNDSYDGIDPKELQELVGLFQQELYSALKDRFEVVYKPGPGVMRLSTALTGVESPNRLLAATSTFTPIGLGISTVSRIVIGEHTNVGSASMEILGSDSVSNKAIFAAIDRRPGTKDLKKIIDPLSDAKEAFKWWAKRLRVGLEGRQLPAK